MKDLSAAERRLIAALDRLDHAIERAARRIAEMPADAPPPPGPSAGAAEAGVSRLAAARRGSYNAPDAFSGADIPN